MRIRHDLRHVLLLCVWTWLLLLAGESRAEQDPTVTPEPTPVLVGERTVLKFHLPLRGQSARDRAVQASKELEAAIPLADDTVVKQHNDGVGIVVYVGERPVFILTQEDALAANQDSLQVYADAVCARVAEIVVAERQRAKVAKRVFSASLVVFFGLIVILLLRQISVLGDRARKWAEERGDTLSLRILQFELIRPEMVQSAAVISVTLGTWIVRLGVVYAWLAVALSLFEATRGYTGKLATVVLTPVSDLASRLASILPVIIVAIVAAIATWVVVRFVGLLFASVARRETQLAWVPADLATPTSVVLRVAIVLSALAFVAPAVTGAPDGSVARTALLALLAFALAAVPVLASAGVGAVHLFGHRFPPGVHVQVGEFRGRLINMTFLELRLMTELGDEVRIPSLHLLRAPVTIVNQAGWTHISLTVESEMSTLELTRLILECAAPRTSRTEVQLVAFDGSRRQFHVKGKPMVAAEPGVLTPLVDDLGAAGLRITSGQCLNATGFFGATANTSDKVKMGSHP